MSTKPGLIIENFEDLATTDLRRDALEIAEAGYQALRVEDIIAANIAFDGTFLHIGGQKFKAANFKHIYVVGVGKGSSLAARAVEKVLGPERITAGCVIDIHQHKLRKIKSLLGTHPLPSDQNIRATDKVVAILRRAKSEDLVISIICGGGSALFCRPGALTSLELQFISSMLLRAGASIQEINTVRKHASLIHGGRMAEFAFPSTVVSMIISDVPGNDIEMVSSGPTVLDTTTKQQAEAIAKHYGLPKLKLVETPKDKRYFQKVHNVMIASGDSAVDAMGRKAKELGYKPRVLSRKLSGMANEVGPQFGREVKPGEALLACGETEVIVLKPGKGGRNQDVALSAINQLAPDAVIVSAASDGKDNVEVAGAIADGTVSVAKLKKLKINPDDAVRNNASFDLLMKMNDHLQIHKVTANVSDFIVAIRGHHGS